MVDWYMWLVPVLVSALLFLWPSSRGLRLTAWLIAAILTIVIIIIFSITLIGLIFAIGFVAVLIGIVAMVLVTIFSPQRRIARSGYIFRFVLVAIWDFTYIYLGAYKGEISIPYAIYAVVLPTATLFLSHSPFAIRGKKRRLRRTG